MSRKESKKSAPNSSDALLLGHFCKLLSLPGERFKQVTDLLGSEEWVDRFDDLSHKKTDRVLKRMLAHLREGAETLPQGTKDRVEARLAQDLVENYRDWEVADSWY